jgi:uracil-DNA glycosylase
LSETFRQRALIEMGIGQGWVRRSPFRLVDETLAESISAAVMLCASLDALTSLIGECVACERTQARTRPLPGQGNRKASLMIVDRVREEAGSAGPLSGSAGRLFEQMLFSIGLKRDDVYFAHSLRCEGGAPSRVQCNLCSAFLEKEIELVAPKVVMILGSEASESVTSLRDSHFAAKVVEMPHPLALLADNSLKKRAWASLLAVRDALAARAIDVDEV